MRIRTIRPEFWESPQIGRLSHHARLTFIGLWNMADREGRLKDRPEHIAIKLFPYDRLKPAQVDRWLEELARQNLIVRYRVAGEAYIAIPTWRRHQRPHPHEAQSEIPPPPPESCASKNVSFSPPPPSTSRAHELDPDSPSTQASSPSQISSDPCALHAPDPEKSSNYELPPAAHTPAPPNARPRLASDSDFPSFSPRSSHSTASSPIHSAGQAVKCNGKALNGDPASRSINSLSSNVQSLFSPNSVDTAGSCTADQAVAFHARASADPSTFSARRRVEVGFSCADAEANSSFSAALSASVGGDWSEENSLGRLCRQASGLGSLLLPKTISSSCAASGSDTPCLARSCGPDGDRAGAGAYFPEREPTQGAPFKPSSASAGGADGTAGGGELRWEEQDRWLERFLRKRQRTFSGPTLDVLLSDYDFWCRLSEAVGGLSLEMLEAEFAKMALWLDGNPSRAPSAQTVKRFVARWLERAVEGQTRRR